MKKRLSLLLSLSLLVALPSCSDSSNALPEEPETTITETTTEVVTNITETSAEESTSYIEGNNPLKEEITDNVSNMFIRNEELTGRGMSDSGRSEPNYINVIGYAVVSFDEQHQLNETDSFANESLWEIHTYDKDKQFWNETQITLPHKTEVAVLEQYLTHEGHGRYSGYLLVEKIDDGSQYYIDVTNYITMPYWTYEDDLKKAAKKGCFIAEYKQVSDTYPVTKNDDKVELNDGTKVFVTGVQDYTGAIVATVWKEWRNGYGGVNVYFNSEDLTLIF